MPGNTIPSRRTRILRVVGILAGLAVAGVVYLLVVSQTGKGIPCLIRLCTGVLCGSCGLTRAFGAVLRLDFTAAFAYNPLWPVYSVWAIWIAVADSLAYIRHGRVQSLPKPLWVHIALAVAIAVFGVWRNF